MENEYQRITRGRSGILIYSSRAGDIMLSTRREIPYLREIPKCPNNQELFCLLYKDFTNKKTTLFTLPFFRGTKRASDVSATDWRLQKRKIVVIFHVWTYVFSQWRKSLQRAPVYTINYDKSARSAIMCLIGSTYESINVASNKTKAQQRRPSLPSFRPC